MAADTSNIMQATIGQYSDFFSEWYGLRDGTILDVSNPVGRMWRKFGDDEPIYVSHIYGSR